MIKNIIFKNIIYSTILLVIFASCEMKKELTGVSTGDKTEIGVFEIDLALKNEATAPTKTDAALSANDLSVQILNKEGLVYKSFETYTAFQEAHPIELPAAEYFLKSYHGELENASNKPYYESLTPFKIQASKTTKLTDTCSLATVKVAITLTPEFLEVFKDDYSITVTNHDSGILVHNSLNQAPMYFKTNAQQTRVSLAIKATNIKTGKPIETSQEIIKQGDYDEGVILPGDFFNIKIDTTYSMDISNVYPKLSIDLTMIKTDVTVSVPTDNIIPPTDPDLNPDPNPDPDPTPDPNTPVIEGDGIETPLTFAHGSALPLVVNTTIPNGIQKFEVTIITIPELTVLLKPMELDGTFDMANLTEIQKGALIELKLLTADEVVIGAKTKKFDLTTFMPLLPVGEHTFRLAITDAKGLANTKDIVVIVTQ